MSTAVSLITLLYVCFVSDFVLAWESDHQDLEEQTGEHEIQTPKRGKSVDMHRSWRQSFLHKLQKAGLRMETVLSGLGISSAFHWSYCPLKFGGGVSQLFGRISSFGKPFAMQEWVTVRSSTNCTPEP